MPSKRKMWSFSAPWFLLGGIGVVSLLGQFARAATPLGLVSYYEFGIILFTLFIARRIRFWQWFLQQRFIWWATAFLGWSLSITLLQNFFAGTLWTDMSGYAYLAKMVLYLLFGATFWFWQRETVVSKKEKRMIFRGTVSWFVIWAVLGLSQYILLPDTRILSELGWDDHLSRAFATLFDPTFYGVLMALAAIWVLSWKHKATVFTSFLTALFLLALAVSYSRLAYLVYILGVLSIWATSRSRRVLLAVPLLLMALVLLPKDGGGAGQNLLRTQSITQRVEHATFQTSEWSWSEQLLGRGWSEKRFVAVRSQGIAAQYGDNESSGGTHASVADSAYLHILLTSGVVGLVFMSGTMFTLWQKVPATAKPVLLAFFFSGFGAPTLFYGWILLGVIFVIGVSAE